MKQTQSYIFPSTRSSKSLRPINLAFYQNSPLTLQRQTREEEVAQIYILAHSRPRSVDDVDVAKLLIDSVITRR